MFVDEPQNKALPVKPSVLNTSTELTDAVTAVPRVPLAEVPASPDIICLEDSMGKFIASLLYLFLSELQTMLLELIFKNI